MRCFMRLLCVAYFAWIVGAADNVAKAIDLGLNSTSSQHVCWVFDQAVTTVDRGAQINHAQILLLNDTSGSLKVPEQIVNQLRVARHHMSDFQGWAGDLTGRIGVLFSTTPTVPGDLESALKDLEAFISQPLPVTKADVQFSASTWTEHCSENVLVRPFLLVLDQFARELREMDAVLAESSRHVFGLRSKRASAAGTMAAYEEAAGASATARGETLAGVFNASREVETLLWKDASLRRKVDLALAADMNRTWRQTVVAVAPVSHRFDVARHDATQELKRADKALLDGMRALQEAAEDWDNLSDKMRLHLKSMLSQCLPPDSKASRSRYARFATSSPAASAVQLTFETIQFLRHALAGPVPSLIEVLRDTVGELRASTPGIALEAFREAPLMTQWWKWLPQGGVDEPMPLSFADLANRFRQVSSEHDDQLASGGRAAALHAMWIRLRETLQESSIIKSGTRNENKVPPEATVRRGLWARLSLLLG